MNVYLLTHALWLHTLRSVSTAIHCEHTTMRTGLQNKTSCSKCRRRKGYSAFRKSTKQDGSLVRAMYSWVHDNPAGLERNKIKAVSAKLRRWGFNAKRRCCLHVITDVDKVLVRIPGRDEVFPCLENRDRMHSMFIFFVTCYHGSNASIGSNS